MRVHLGSDHAGYYPNQDAARLGREHNNATISIGARMHSTTEAVQFVEAFLQTPFGKDPWHVRRIGMISDYEQHRSK